MARLFLLPAWVMGRRLDDRQRGHVRVDAAGDEGVRRDA